MSSPQLLPRPGWNALRAAPKTLHTKTQDLNKLQPDAKPCFCNEVSTSCFTGGHCQERSRNSSCNVNILGDMVVRNKFSTESSDVAQLWVTSAHVEPRRVRWASLYKLMQGTSLCNHLQFFWTRLAADKQPKNKCEQIFEEYNSASNWQISLL